MRQRQAEGTLLLEQNDGNRRIHWVGGNIVFLQSDVAGEQFGNFLLRRGVLDHMALKELLTNDENFRLGQKVVQWGLMSEASRDEHLQILQEQIMIHALEHPVLRMEWTSGQTEDSLSDDLRFSVDHRHFVWRTFQEARNGANLCDLFFEKSKWRWVAPGELLGLVHDLPLTPALAFALSFWSRMPMGFEWFLSVSELGEEETARLIATLWALGGLHLVDGEDPELGTLEISTATFAPLAASAPIAPTSVSTPPIEIPLDQQEQGHSGSQPTPPREYLQIELIEPVTGSFPTIDINQSPRKPPTEIDEGPVASARKLFLRAKHLLSQDRMAEAIRLLEQSVKLDPDSPQAYDRWILLGKHRMENPAWSTRAIEALQSAAGLKPKVSEPWALMGEVYHRKGFLTQAKACFERALEVDPETPVPDDMRPGASQPEEEEPVGLLKRFKGMFGGK
ncbi:MAG: tetratricopeptide repeat protein [Firmicutes bacterium]|nr:tetratricopeptide repeat protein [Bacillota bacterium]